MEVIKEENEAAEEEDLVEVTNKLFSITAEHQGTTGGSVRTKHTRHVNTSASVTTL